MFCQGKKRGTGRRRKALLEPRLTNTGAEKACKPGRTSDVRNVMSLLALLSNFGGPDLIIILLIILVLFGAKKLPELAKGMGQAVREFQKAKDEFTDELHNAGKNAPA